MKINSFYAYVRKLYCDDLYDWHPVFGVPDRPYKMNGTQFHEKMYGYDLHWWMWEEYNNHVGTLSDMIEECEYSFGRFYRKNGNDYIPLRKTKAIKLTRPLVKVEKRKNSNIVIEQWHLPAGRYKNNLIKRENAELMNKWLSEGVTIHEIQKRTGFSFNGIVRYTNYEVGAKEKEIKEVKRKVRKAKKLILSGMSQAEALRQVDLPKHTFWKHTGGKQKILNKRKDNGTTS